MEHELYVGCKTKSADFETLIARVICMQDQKRAQVEVQISMQAARLCP